LPALAAELVADPAAAIVALAPPAALAAKAASTTTPIVFAIGADPVELYRDDRLQSDRNSGMVPTPVQPRNSPDPNPLPGEEPRPIPR
jgi:hypothetical protein